MSQAINGGKAWTFDDVDELRYLLYLGVSVKGIAQRLGRSELSVKARIVDEFYTKSAPGLFAAVEPVVPRVSAGCQGGFPAACRRPLTDRDAGVSSGHRPNHTARLDGDSALIMLEAECGLCGYTTDKCSCSYGI